VRLPLLSSRPAVPDAVGTGLETIRERAQGAASEAVDALGPRLDAAREQLAPKLAEAAERTGALATQLAEEAREIALPRLEAARDQAVTTMKTRVIPRVSKTIAEAAAVSGPVRVEAKQRGEAAIAAMRGELPTRRRRWPRAILLMGAGAVAGAAAGLMAGRRQPAAPGLDAYTPMGSADPYARTEPPRTTDSTGTTTTDTAATAATPSPPPAPHGDATIDVTEEPVSLSGDGEQAQSTTSRKPRRTQSS
jgi:hypothetical protein